jgi:Family of unknown function (DUF6042)
VEPEWQWAAMAPSWIRWLPCSISQLRIVADPYRFSRDAWDALPDPMPWDEPVWCDPGDIADWIAQAATQHGPGEEAIAELHAREHYEQAVELRSARIELFGTMCRRAGVAVPHTLGELLACLAEFGLFHLEVDEAHHEWLYPRLWLNPVDVLPLTADEAAVEVRTQLEERGVLAAIGLRRLAEEADIEGTGRRTITASLRAIADAADLPVGQTRDAVAVLAREREIELTGPDIDLAGLESVGLDTPILVQVEWPDFADAFGFDELPAPEHMI